MCVTRERVNPRHSVVGNVTCAHTVPCPFKLLLSFKALISTPRSVQRADPKGNTPGGCSKDLGPPRDRRALWLGFLPEALGVRRAGPSHRRCASEQQQQENFIKCLGFPPPNHESLPGKRLSYVQRGASTLLSMVYFVMFT